MIRRLSIIGLACALLNGLALSQNAPQPGGSVQGLAFTTEQDHSRSVVPGTKVSLDGALHLEAESNSEGSFVFPDVPTGVYTVTAHAPGLTATRSVEVRSGSVSQLELEMKLQVVAESTTVKAISDPVDAKEPSGSNAISQSAIVHMPNRDEHFENLLPLVPGVVRGPNGQINMKGARASQSGSLVNSADVTDPATGATAISIPIDVVSKVEIYGRGFQCRDSTWELRQVSHFRSEPASASAAS